MPGTAFKEFDCNYTIEDELENVSIHCNDH